ncbi:hypothetical protein D9M68_569550 [compost metagenome]
MHADAGIGGTRAARAESQPGTAGQLAAGFGHDRGTAFLAADNKAQLVAAAMEAVEHRQVAFTRHAEGQLGAVRQQRINQEMAAQ